jgi:hypothetical protein
MCEAMRRLYRIQTVLSLRMPDYDVVYGGVVVDGIEVFDSDFFDYHYSVTSMMIVHVVVVLS